MVLSILASLITVSSGFQSQPADHPSVSLPHASCNLPPFLFLLILHHLPLTPHPSNLDLRFCFSRRSIPQPGQTALRCTASVSADRWRCVSDWRMAMMSFTRPPGDRRSACVVFFFLVFFSSHLFQSFDFSWMLRFLSPVHMLMGYCSFKL